MWSGEVDPADGVLKSLHQARTPLTEAFFGAQNIATIQGDLRTIIFNKTGYIIGTQSSTDLVTIMRGLFVLHANQGEDPDTERRRLNAIVLSEVTPMVGTGISQYLGYVRDASTMATPLERPKNLSIKGRNTLELFRPI